MEPITDEMVTVAVYDSQLEADLVRNELEAAGIDAWIAGGTIAQTFVTMPETGIQVEVRSVDVDKANEILSGNSRIVPDDILTASDDAEAGG